MTVHCNLDVGAAFAGETIEHTDCWLLIGLTAANQGAVVGLIRHDDGSFQPLGLPFVANFDAAERAIKVWQAEHAIERTIIFYRSTDDRKGGAGQRPVENIVASAVSRRFGGMQPANTGRRGMFDEGAPIWPFLDRLGGPADILSCSRHTADLKPIRY